MGRLAWFDRWSPWYFPLVFILEDNWEFVFTPHPWSAKRSASFLGTTESAMSVWMQDLMDDPSSGFSVPW
eukprot:c46045_g1_i1 orf=105-314(+)